MEVREFLERMGKEKAERIREGLPKTDRFGLMFHLQFILMEVVKNNNDGMSGGVSGNLTALMVEAAEMQNAVGHFKWWKKNHVCDEKEALEEYVDILFFWLQAGILMDWTPEQIYEAYAEKWDENINRQINHY